MFNIVTAKKTLFQETSTWAARVVSAGGGFEPNSVAIANNLVRQVKNASFGPKIVYLLPLLGRGIGAARVPLIDLLNVGSATNTAFVDADFSQNTGLQGNGSSKQLDTLIFPGQLGASANGGIGYVAETVDESGTTQVVAGCMAAANVQRFAIDLRNTTAVRRFFWGNSGNSATQAINAIAGHYYGQRSSSTSRVIYLNGSNIASNTTSDTTSNNMDFTMRVLGSNNSGTPVYNKGLCGMMYLTDGTLTDPEIVTLDTMIRAYLLGPCGKGQP